MRKVRCIQKKISGGFWEGDDPHRPPPWGIFLYYALM